MKIAIHQPNFLPWLGYFYKMAQADVFVLLDNVQYEKNGLTNRVRLKTPRGGSWLTLPIQRKFPQLIQEAKLADFPKVRSKILKTIELNYRRAKYFDYLFPQLQKTISQDWQSLSALNTKLIKLVNQKIGIKTKLAIASDYQVSGRGDDLLINLCKFFKADTYLSGAGGSKYQKETKFKQAGIKLEYASFSQPNYLQLWREFIPGLSAIDLIFNCGPQSLKILLTK